MFLGILAVLPTDFCPKGVLAKKLLLKEGFWQKNFFQIFFPLAFVRRKLIVNRE